MPWWGWLIAASLVFVVLVVAAVYVYAIRKVTTAQAEIDKTLGDNLRGPYYRGHFPER